MGFLQLSLHVHCGSLSIVGGLKLFLIFTFWFLDGRLMDNHSTTSLFIFKIKLKTLGIWIITDHVIIKILTHRKSVNNSSIYCDIFKIKNPETSVIKTVKIWKFWKLLLIYSVFSYLWILRCASHMGQYINTVVKVKFRFLFFFKFYFSNKLLKKSTFLFIFPMCI